MKIRLSVWGSGTGSNADIIMRYFHNHPTIQVAQIVSNKSDVGILDKAAKWGVPSLVIVRERFVKGDAYIPELQNAQIDKIVLAGFLWKVPETLIAAFPSSIVNIHPALLPKYGGKGMYGMHVHEAVIAAGEQQSGITIHLVDEQYDHGKHLAQFTCDVHSSDTPQDLATKIHALEHRHYSEVIEQWVTGKL
ncbi:MAG: phosphoribosylglycinamide formyltransferase [Sediminibacterium sp.]|jgi:phosphoribosylglycinamide formyltransferase-1|nr:phosphoribosylglycinamide formyltransferase [Sediminibacterium sp.]